MGTAWQSSHSKTFLKLWLFKIPFIPISPSSAYPCDVGRWRILLTRFHSAFHSLQMQHSSYYVVFQVSPVKRNCVARNSLQMPFLFYVVTCHCSILTHHYHFLRSSDSYDSAFQPLLPNGAIGEGKMLPPPLLATCSNKYLDQGRESGRTGPAPNQLQHTRERRPCHLCSTLELTLL